MLLAFDISNSTIKAGVFRNEDLIAHWQFATERHKQADDYAMLILNLFQTGSISSDDITGVSISCVVPPLRSVFSQLVRRYLDFDPFIIGPEVNTGIKLEVDYPFEVGGDRIANAFATHKLYGGPAISIAFGTATVFDCITSDGRYLGGAIAPGMVGALESLTQSAAQLYKVELVRPGKAIGRNTVHTMQSGLVLGFTGLVEGLVTRLKSEMLEMESNHDFKVIATGGLAEIVAPETDAIDIVDQRLTLKGIRLVYDLNR